MKLNYLADDFTPGKHDVVCGRGKKCYAHEGNLNFRSLCEDNGVLYTNAKTKDEKSIVVGKVISEVRRQSPGGGFVKQDEQGRWYEVGDFLAREKTSQAFREILFGKYKSSTVSRRKLRQDKRDSKQVSTASAMNKTCSERSTDRRRSESDAEPGFKKFFAEAIRVARTELENDMSDSSSGFARKGSLSDPSLNKLQSSRSQTEMRSFPTSCAKRMPAPESVPHHFRSQQAKRIKSIQYPGGTRMENLCAAARSQRPTKWESKLPDIPISFLLRDGRPLHIDPAALHQACQEYDRRHLSMVSPGYWKSYSRSEEPG